MNDNITKISFEVAGMKFAELTHELTEFIETVYKGKITSHEFTDRRDFQMPEGMDLLQYHEMMKSIMGIMLKYGPDTFLRHLEINSSKIAFASREPHKKAKKPDGTDPVSYWLNG